MCEMKRVRPCGGAESRARIRALCLKRVVVSFAVEPRPISYLKAWISQLHVSTTTKMSRSWRLRDQGGVQKMTAPLWQGKVGASSVRVSYEEFAVLRGGLRDQVEVEPRCEMSSLGTQRQNGVFSGSPHGESGMERLVLEKRCLDSVIAMGSATEGISKSLSEPSIRIIKHTLSLSISHPPHKKALTLFSLIIYSRSRWRVFLPRCLLVSCLP